MALLILFSEEVLMDYSEKSRVLRLAGTYSSLYGEANPKADGEICRLRGSAIQLLSEDRDEEATSVVILLRGLLEKTLGG